MRLCFALLALLLGTLCPPAFTRVRGDSDAEAVADSLPRPLAPLPKDETLRSAYLDAYRVLSRENSCSAFYGGPAPSLTVLNRLVAAAKKKALEVQGVGIRMTGQITYCRHGRLGTRYRLFAEVTLNSRGLFYSGQPFGPAGHFADSNGRRFGERALRVMLLLHELAHLVEGPDGRWLIPNDGGDAWQSFLNTRAVLARCGPQLGSLNEGAAEAPAGLAVK